MALEKNDLKEIKKIVDTSVQRIVGKSVAQSETRLEGKIESAIKKSEAYLEDRIEYNISRAENRLEKRIDGIDNRLDDLQDQIVDLARTDSEILLIVSKQDKKYNNHEKRISKLEKEVAKA